MRAIISALIVYIVTIFSVICTIFRVMSIDLEVSKELEHGFEEQHQGGRPDNQVYQMVNQNLQGEDEEDARTGPFPDAAATAATTEFQKAEIAGGKDMGYACTDASVEVLGEPTLVSRMA